MAAIRQQQPGIGEAELRQRHNQKLWIGANEQSGVSLRRAV